MVDLNARMTFSRGVSRFIRKTVLRSHPDGLLEIFQRNFSICKIQNLACVEHLNTDNTFPGTDVDRNPVVDLEDFTFGWSLDKADVEGIYLLVVADFHIYCPLSEIEGIYCDNHKLFRFLCNYGGDLL